MAVAITGSIYSDVIVYPNGSASGYGTISNITVPADADMAIVLSLTCAGSGSQFDELNFNGDTDQDFTLIVEMVDSTDAHMRAYRLFSDDANWPGSGSGKTLTYSLANDMAYDDGFVVLFFLSGVDSSSNWANYLIGTDTGAGTQTNWTNTSLGTLTSNDMAIIAAGDWTNTIECTPTGEGQTELFEDNAQSSWKVGMAYKLNDDQLTVNGSFGTYFGGIAFAIKGAAGGTTYQFSADINGVSSTPGIDLAVARELSANIAGASASSDVSLAVARILAAAINAATDTAAIVLAVQRTVAANISATSNTSDIELLLSSIVTFAANISGQSVTPDIALAVARRLAAAPTGQSATADIVLSAARQFHADINVQSLTSAIDLVISALGLIVNPTIQSLTVQRSLKSKTPQRSVKGV